MAATLHHGDRETTRMNMTPPRSTVGSLSSRRWPSIRLAPVFVLAVALMLPAGPAAAATPAPILITTHVDFSGQVNVGTFTTLQGPLCADGTFADSIAAEGGSANGQALNVLVLRVFTCADGVDSFDVQFEVHFLPTGAPDTASGHWTAQGGAGAFAGLNGSGAFSIVIDPATATGNETFSGFVVG